MTRRRPLRALAVLCAPVVLLALAGCQGAYDLPLPGGGARGSDVYHVTVEFADVLDLVPQSAVKVGEVTVGAVEGVDLDGWTAKVRVRLKDSVKLPDNATAELKQTSLLGEKYVSLQAPAGQTAVGHLGEGDVVPLARSGRNPEVEEVLGALSLLLNGGGVAQLKVIETELNKALGGNEAEIKSLLSRLDTLVGSLDQQKSEIVRAIDSIDALAARLQAQRGDIALALEQIPGGLKVLADQREQLTTLLTSLSDLGRVGSKVIKASKDDTVANLTSLKPILAGLEQAGDSLPNSLELLLTYPFPDKALDGVKGDYTNLYITAQVDARSLIEFGLGDTGPAGGGGGLPTQLPSLPGLPTLPHLPVPTVTCTLGGVKVPLPGKSCPKILPTTKTVQCRGQLTGLVFPFPAPDCPAGSTKVTKPSGSSTSGGGGGGGGGVCLPGVLCLGSAERSSYDPGLARLMLGGLAR